MIHVFGDRVVRLSRSSFGGRDHTKIVGVVSPDARAPAFTCERGLFRKSAKQRRFSGVQFEGNSSEEEVDGLCEVAVNGGSSCVRNMACELCGNCF